MKKIALIDEHRKFIKSIDDINNTSSSEFCKNIDDLKKSQSVKKIISSIVNKSKEILESEDLLNTYEKYIKGEIITSEERENFINFLESSNNKKILNQILSKLRILLWDENESFISSFLKDSNQKLNASKFIDYLIKELRIYKLVINNAKDIKKIEEIKWVWEYYTYQNLLNNKLWLVLKKCNNIILCDDSYISVEINPDNWMIRWKKEFNWEEVLVLTNFNWIEFKDLLIIERE